MVPPQQPPDPKRSPPKSGIVSTWAVIGAGAGFVFGFLKGAPAHLPSGDLGGLIGFALFYATVGFVVGVLINWTRSPKQ